MQWVKGRHGIEMKIVLLPGLDGSGKLFKPFIDALPGEIDSLVISYPPYSKLSYAALVEFVIRQLPNEKFILIGESFSGPIAYQVALSKPKYLESVIFVATFLDSPLYFLQGISSYLPISILLKMPIPDFIVKSFLFEGGTDRQITGLFKLTMKQVSAEVLSFRIQEIGKLSKNHQVCNVRAIYIQATRDNFVPKRCVEAFKKVFDDINVFQIEGSHFILQSNPRACVEIVENEIHQIQRTSS